MIIVKTLPEINCKPALKPNLITNQTSGSKSYTGSKSYIDIINEIMRGRTQSTGDWSFFIHGDEKRTQRVLG